jgi:hypothetical protein
MATVIKKKAGLRTVGEVIAALQQFPADMPCVAGFDDEVTVYQKKPQPGEHFEDSRGEVQIDGEDPFGDD